VSSLPLRTTARLLIPHLILYSCFMILQGHDAPGGGFIGALVAIGAFALYMLAFDPGSIARVLRVNYQTVLALGMSLVTVGAGAATLVGEPLLTARWVESTLAGPWWVKIGTPLLFDAGIYLTVLGASLTVIVELEGGA
jgi:multicomponent Na+:H+ antiporter subunit B